nr:hypothetical protein [Nocardiopsis xinjiangensis]
MAELKYFTGSMNSGKSTMALQEHHSRGGEGVLYTKQDRAGSGVISSRLGLKATAEEIGDLLDLYDDIADRKVPYVIVDEAQFLSHKQVGQLAGVVDGIKIDVYCYGILTDFQGQLFPGSKRLLALAGTGPHTTPEWWTGSWCTRANRYTSEGKSRTRLCADTTSWLVWLKGALQRGYLAVRYPVVKTTIQERRDLSSLPFELILRHFTDRILLLPLEVNRINCTLRLQHDDVRLLAIFIFPIDILGTIIKTWNTLG